MHWTFGIDEGFRQPLHNQINKFYSNKRIFYDELQKFILIVFLVKNSSTLFYFPVC